MNKRIIATTPKNKALIIWQLIKDEFETKDVTSLEGLDSKTKKRVLDREIARSLFSVPN
jgi:hypothetical protein